MHLSFINTEIHKTGIHETPFLLMIDLTHIIDFATQLPHPSDLGLVKPSGGFQLLPAIFGVIAIVQVSQFHWYARKGNDPSERFTRWLVCQIDLKTLQRPLRLFITSEN